VHDPSTPTTLHQRDDASDDDGDDAPDDPGDDAPDDPVTGT
jgi:hypothetical protein